MLSARSRIAKIKTELLEGIKSFMESRNATEINVTFSSNCPLVIHGDDDWNTYTLDRVILQTNPENTLYRIWFDASSSYDNISVAADNINIELLADIVEWLEENAEEIDNEIAEE